MVSTYEGPTVYLDMRTVQLATQIICFLVVNVCVKPATLFEQWDNRSVLRLENSVCPTTVPKVSRRENGFMPFQRVSARYNKINSYNCFSRNTSSEANKAFIMTFLFGMISGPTHHWYKVGAPQLYLAISLLFVSFTSQYIYIYIYIYMGDLSSM